MIYKGTFLNQGIFGFLGRAFEVAVRQQSPGFGVWGFEVPKPQQYVESWPSWVVFRGLGLLFYLLLGWFR